MTTLTATFRIVTPMFLSGADQSKAELRVPSIKGALRFWWRALQWGQVQDVSELHKREAALFGSSDGGQSKILLSIDPLLKGTDRPPPWKIMDRETGWKCYSGYGLHEGKRAFLKPGQNFNLHLSYHNLGNDDLQSVLQAIQLFGLLGGLGSRSRNGWGSITLVEMEGFECPVDLSSVQAAIQELVSSTSIAGPLSAISSNSQISIGKPFLDAERAHRWIVEKYRSINSNDDVKKADFVELGLPRKSKHLTPIEQDKRRASPVLLHVHQGVSGPAIPLAIWLPSKPWHPMISLPGSPGNAPHAILSAVKTATS